MELLTDISAFLKLIGAPALYLIGVLLVKYLHSQRKAYLTAKTERLALDEKMQSDIGEVCGELRAIQQRLTDYSQCLDKIRSDIKTLSDRSDSVDRILLLGHMRGFFARVQSGDVKCSPGNWKSWTSMYEMYKLLGGNGEADFIHQAMIERRDNFNKTQAEEAEGEEPCQ